MNDCSVYLRQRSSALDSVASSSMSTAGRSRTCVGQHGTSRQRGVSTGPARLSTGSARGQHGVSTRPARGQHAAHSTGCGHGQRRDSAHCVCLPIPRLRSIGVPHALATGEARSRRRTGARSHHIAGGLSVLRVGPTYGPGARRWVSEGSCNPPHTRANETALLCVGTRA